MQHRYLLKHGTRRTRYIQIGLSLVEMILIWNLDHISIFQYSQPEVINWRTQARRWFTNSYFKRTVLDDKASTVRQSLLHHRLSIHLLLVSHQGQLAHAVDNISRIWLILNSHFSQIYDFLTYFVKKNQKILFWYSLALVIMNKLLIT